MTFSTLRFLITISIALNSICKQCGYNFKVYIYEISNNVEALRLAEEARLNNSYHVCKKCIYVSFDCKFVYF